MVRCSVIVPAFNKAHLTRQCLDQLFAVPGESDFEVIVVDDASRDRTTQVLANYRERIRVVRQEINLGFAASCNAGAALATGDYLVFLNNDTVPLTCWLDALVSYADAHPQAGAVAAKLLYPDGTIQHAGIVVGQDRGLYHLYAGFPADHPAVNRARRFQMVTGACLLVPRPLFAAAGGFDTAFINGYEDVDLCLRLGEAGYEVHYCPESQLFHLESVSEGRFAHDERNTRLYHERWGNRVPADDVHYFLEDGLLEIINRGLCVEVRVAPQLGVVTGTSRTDTADRLLLRRSQQVLSLLKENTVLRAATPPIRQLIESS